MSINYLLGQALEKVGYRVLKRSRWYEANCNLIEIGFALLTRSIDADVTVVQIGAFDGQLADPLQRIVSYYRSRCLLIEPQPGPFQILQNRYSGNSAVTLVNAAITDQDGAVTLHVPSNEASPWASVDPNHYKRFGRGKNAVRKISVPSLTPVTLLAKYSLDRVDVLQVDTEGFDARLICLFLQSGIRPSIINFESLHCLEADLVKVLQLFKANGYWWVKGDQDTFAIKESLVHNALGR
jgi:FkbM family methyltransferase